MFTVHYKVSLRSRPNMAPELAFKCLGYIINGKSQIFTVVSCAMNLPYALQIHSIT